MSARYLLKVSIGPVQEFIAEARKTRDLWVGSYLLSRVTFEAMRPFIDSKAAEIIYPALDISPFYRNFYSPSKPAHRELEAASLPNHFLVSVAQDDIDSLIEESKNRLESFWDKLAEGVRKYIAKNINAVYDGWDSQWDVQTCDLWQYIWVAIPVDDCDLKGKYQEKAGQIQRFLEERKLTRTFSQWDGSAAIKCTQCAHREALGPDELPGVSGFWEEFRIKFKANVRKGDRLCAICTVKRFLRSSDMLKGLSEVRFGSTRDIAVITFKEFISSHKDELGDKVQNLISRAGELKSFVYQQDKVSTSVGDIEGDFLYKDDLTPEKLLKEYFPELKEGTGEYASKGGELKKHSDGLVKAIDDICKRQGGEIRPSKYYAVLFFDGDDMGKWMSGALPDAEKTPLTRRRHEDLSAKLGALGVGIMPRIVSSFSAYTVYSGGDDLLVLAPLEYATALLQELRSAFADNGLDPAATASAGMVIVHYSDSFRRALVEGRKAVERAKSMFKDKDSFSITLMLSSGTVVTGGYKWYFGSGGGEVSAITDVLENLVSLQQEKVLSPRFIYDMLSSLQHFYYFDGRNRIVFDQDMFVTETERVFKRHMDDESRYTEIKPLTGHLSIIADAGPRKKFDVQHNLEGLLRISNFIARESIGY